MPWSLQQRVLRAVPPEARANSLRLRGQKHQGVGHDQEDVPQYLPTRERTLLGAGCTPHPKSLRCRARLRNGHLQGRVLLNRRYPDLRTILITAGKRETGLCRARKHPVLCEGEVFEEVGLYDFEGCASDDDQGRRPYSRSQVCTFLA